MSTKLEKAVKIALNAGYHLDADAFSILKEMEDPEEVIKKAIEKAESLPEKSLFITKSILEEVAAIPPKEIVIEITGKELFRPFAKEVESKVEVVSDPTPELGSSGSEADFLRYFEDRFKKVEKILGERLDTRGAISIDEALKSRHGEAVKVIGFVANKVEGKRRIVLEVEDLESSARVIVLSTNPTAFEKAQRIVLDQLICIEAVRGRDTLVAVDFIWPDLPERERVAKSDVPVCAVLTSDLHVGSKKFVKDSFDRFLKWLKGDFGSKNERELAGRVKYVVIAGDLVDGVGIYPGQELELEISSVYTQYSEAAQYLQRIPDYVEVIIIPGNHDATRQALPQPAIFKDYGEAVYSARRVFMLGNPSVVRLHGVGLLLYHGVSLEDLIGSIRGLSYQSPEEAMKILLQSRHLAPIYGKNTPIAPESRDYLIIDENFDVFHAGHVHVNGYTSYKKRLIVNSGAWQEKTDYQRKMGIEPTPGRVPILDLQTLTIGEIDFSG